MSAETIRLGCHPRRLAAAHASRSYQPMDESDRYIAGTYGRFEARTPTDPVLLFLRNIARQYEALGFGPSTPGYDPNGYIVPSGESYFVVNDGLLEPGPAADGWAEQLGGMRLEEVVDLVQAVSTR